MMFLSTRTIRTLSFTCILCVLLLAACQGTPLTAVQPIATLATPTAAPLSASVTALPTVTPPSTETPFPPITVMPAPTASPVLSLSPTMDSLPVPEADILLALAQAVPPVRDNARLAQAYRGLTAEALPTPRPAVSQPLEAGTLDTFTVLDVVNNRVGEIEAELRAAGDHAYFWFEAGPFGIEPDPQLLADAVSRFDEIYEDVGDVFGREASPGIDGDPRLHILHASLQTICGVTADGQGGCGIAGFVSFADLQPRALDPQSNEREMFLMNSQFFGGDHYLGVLAHELRHMIESNYSESDTDWEKEGSAVLASELAGLPNSGVLRANDFLADPDQQLNSWSETGKASYYGQGYLFNQYLYDQLGRELYQAFATNPLPGFVALDDIAARSNQAFSGESLWLDWLVALIVHDHPQAPQQFRFSIEGLDTAAVSTLSGNAADAVSQFAADYYLLPVDGGRLRFSGDQTVSLLAGQTDADGRFWYAQRANYSNPRLTRLLDLREVETATLLYDVYADIEAGYDFAYLSVSVDDGLTWTPLAAGQMQGLDPADDPAGSALATRFYSGRDQQWRRERVDLSPYAGQKILLRFEMVTDPILTYSGLAVDNVTVPEIGYTDDESGEGWVSEGFTLAPAIIPQPWRLQLVEFTADGPSAIPIPVDEDGTADFTFKAAQGAQPPVLIVAAAAPMTLEPAAYRLQVID